MVGSVAPGEGVWAVGDIHGCAHLITPLVEAIARHEQDRDGPADGTAPRLIFLGDYVDRGPDASGSLDLLIRLQRDRRFDCRFLMGNHEAVMLEALRDPRAGPAWLSMGGAATLRSYGVEPPALEMSPAAWRTVMTQLEAVLPPEHRAFLDALEFSAEAGDYFFAHAGVHPARPLDQQRTEDLLWIRKPFINASSRLEKVIVHGHTITRDPHVDERRIGIDTGAYRTGVLTAVGLRNATRTFLQAGRLAEEFGEPGVAAPGLAARPAAFKGPYRLQPGV